MLLIGPVLNAIQGVKRAFHLLSARLAISTSRLSLYLRCVPEIVAQRESTWTRTQILLFVRIASRLVKSAFQRILVLLALKDII